MYGLLGERSGGSLGLSAPRWLQERLGQGVRRGVKGSDRTAARRTRPTFAGDWIRHVDRLEPHDRIGDEAIARADDAALLLDHASTRPGAARFHVPTCLSAQPVAVSLCAELRAVVKTSDQQPPLRQGGCADPRHGPPRRRRRYGVCSPVAATCYTNTAAERRGAPD
jgi:hypothetical protein